MLFSSDNDLQKKVPIPSPSHPRQYRAIGLIEGQYQPSQDHQTRGILITKDGQIIDTVVLGKMLSLFKKHITLDQPHLWVVYPRTRLANDQVQLQIAGVWEPETLHPEEEGLSSTEQGSMVAIESGYFSIRGEVVYASYQKKIVIVKIRQSPKYPSKKPKFFKLKLQGTLPSKAVGCFWELNVKLLGDKLTIETGNNLGEIFKNKGGFHKKKSASRFPPRRQLEQDSGHSSHPHPLNRSRPSSRRHPLPKPIKHNPPQSH